MTIGLNPLGLAPLGLGAGAPAAPTVPTLVEAGATTTFTANGTITRPAVAAGDLMVMFTNCSNSDSTITAPSGWASFIATDTNSVFAHESRAFWKIATSAEPASYAVTVLGNGGGNNFGKAQITVWRGVNQATPIQTSAVSSSSTTSLVCPTVTTTAANSLLVCFYCGGSTSTFTPPGGMTELLDHQGGASPAMGVSQQLVASAGATGTRTITASASGTYHTYSFVIAPAATGAGDVTGTMSTTLGTVTANIAGSEQFSGTLASTLAASTMSMSGTVTAPGSRHLYLDPGAAGQASVYHSTAISGTNVTITGKYTVVARENATPQDWHTAHVAWHQGLTNPWPHYVVIFSSGYVQLQKNGSVLDDNFSVSLPYGTQHTFSITQSGTSITVSVNGTQVLNVTDPGTALSGGYVRLIAEESRVRFDDIGGTVTDDFNSYAEASYTATQTFGNWVVWEDGGGTVSIAADSSTVSGSMAATLASITPSITGSETFTGTLGATLAGLTPTISGAETFSGALSATLGGMTPSVTGGETFSGTLSATLAGITPSISGAVTGAGTSGTLAATLQGLTSAITGSEIFSGSLSATLATISMSASGSTSGDASVFGSLTGALSATTMSATGDVKYSGTLAATLGTVLSTINGAETFSGALIRTLADSTMSATGGQEIAGSLAATLSGLTRSISGGITYTGALSATLEDSIAQFIGNSAQPLTGTMAVTLGSMTMNMTGENSTYVPVGAGTMDWRRRGRR